MRISFWDKQKGAAIIAVVLIHSLSSTANFPIDSLNNNFGIILRQFINFPVGLFIFLAAFFAMRSTGTTDSYLDSVKRRIWRLSLPFLIWLFIYCGMKLASGSILIEDIPLMVLNGRSVEVGYFVIVMLQMSIISPFLEKLHMSQLIKLLPVSLILSITTSYSLNFFYNESPWSNFPYYALPFFIWFPFYIGGLIFGKKNEDFWQDISVFWTVVAYFLLVFLSLIEALLVLQDMRGFSMSQLKLTSMLTTGTVCVLVIASWKYGKNKSENIFSWLGQRSYYFYLSHMLVLSKVTGFLENFTIVYDSQIVFVLLITFITLGVVTIGAIVLDRVFSHRVFYRRAFGLA